MYGLIGQMKATPGKRADLAAILLEGSPKCGTVSKANGDSLKLPAVQAAIARGRPLIAGFGSSTETLPLGGAGLAWAR